MVKPARAKALDGGPVVHAPITRGLDGLCHNLTTKLAEVTKKGKSVGGVGHANGGGGSGSGGG